MNPSPLSLEDLIRSSKRALVIGVGGGGDVVGALAAARFLEFCGLKFVLGGLSWERSVYDPIPGPRKVHGGRNVRALHDYAWMANGNTDYLFCFCPGCGKTGPAHDRYVRGLIRNGGVKGA